MTTLKDRTNQISNLFFGIYFVLQGVDEGMDKIASNQTTLIMLSNPLLYDLHFGKCVLDHDNMLVTMPKCIYLLLMCMCAYTKLLLLKENMLKEFKDSVSHYS